MKTLEKIPEKMTAVLLTGHGGFDKLEYRQDVPVPMPEESEVLIKISAASVNNTDINTRTGWYSKQVDTGTNDSSSHHENVEDDGGWSGSSLNFPLIQGADLCGRIVAVGSKVDPSRLGERVIVRNLMRAPCDFRPFECWVFGSECNGGFAQYAVAPSLETYRVESEFTDVELASFSCAYSTAENLLHRSHVQAEDHVLITGASGGVGSAVVQLAKCRGAHVTAISGKDKADQVKSLGADQVIFRDSDPVNEIGADGVDVVIDLVAGDVWPKLLDVLKRGGRYAVAGAIAGPLVNLDVRTLYLKDLTFFGCTFQDDIVFENLIKRIENGDIKPVIANTYPLKEIVTAQKDFLSKTNVGKIVLIPPQ